MTMRKGLPVKNGLTDADDTRYDFRNLVTLNADGTPRQGITGPVGTNLVTGTATMNVSVAAFSAVARRDSGVVLLANDGPTNVLIGTAPVANSRIDLIAARQNDSSATVSAPDANNTPLLYVIPGTASGSPTPPALPDGSVEVGRVTVSAGNTNTNSMVITQASQYTAGVGGVVPFRNRAALDLWTNPVPESRAIVTADSTPTNNAVYRWNGTAWKPWESDWVSYVATWTGVSEGVGGVRTTQFKYRSGMMLVKVRVVLGGSGAAIAIPATFTLPVPAPTPFVPYAALMRDGLYYQDVSATSAFDGTVIHEISDPSRVRLVSLVGGSTLAVQVSSPFGWVTGDAIHGVIEYETA